MNKLYFIVNSGCDATTHGIARIADEDFDKFKTIIENLNRNSYYGCMPTIAVYEIDESKIKEINFNPAADYGEEGYVDLSDIFYLDGKTWVFADDSFCYWVEKKVIG